MPIVNKGQADGKHPAVVQNSAGSGAAPPAAPRGLGEDAELGAAPRLDIEY